MSPQPGASFRGFGVTLLDAGTTDIETDLLLTR